MTSPSLTPRPERVPFSRAVVVTPLDASQPELTLVGANLSRGGMFVKSKERLEPGTKVSLSLEAKGQAFPFAEAEVVWERPAEAATDEVIPGFGLRFVNFLHPRAPELVDALLDKAAAKKKAEKKPEKKELEQVAAPLEKFTELSLEDDKPLAPPGLKKKAAEVKAESIEVEAEPLDAPPIPRRTRTDPEFVSSSESLVIDLEKPLRDESEQDEIEDLPPSAFKSQWPKLMAALAFAPLFLVPIGVAIGTWRASNSAESNVIAATPPAQTDTRTIEFATPLPKPEPVAAVVAVDPAVISPSPELMAEDAPQVAHATGSLDDLDVAPLIAPLVEAPPVKVQARVDPKPRVESAPKKSATLPLELAAVKSLSASMNDGTLELNLNGANVRRAFALKAPNRLVIDLSGPKAPKSMVHEFAKVSGVQRVRVGALPDGVRLVLDLGKPATNIQVKGAKISATLQ